MSKLFSSCFGKKSKKRKFSSISKSTNTSNDPSTSKKYLIRIDDVKNILESSQGVRGLVTPELSDVMNYTKGFFDNPAKEASIKRFQEASHTVIYAFESYDIQKEVLRIMLTSDYGKGALNYLREGFEEVKILAPAKEILPDLKVYKICRGKIESVRLATEIILVLSRHAEENTNLVHVQDLHPESIFGRNSIDFYLKRIKRSNLDNFETKKYDIADLPLDEDEDYADKILKLSQDTKNVAYRTGEAKQHCKVGPYNQESAEAASQEIYHFKEFLAWFVAFNNGTEQQNALDEILHTNYAQFAINQLELGKFQEVLIKGKFDPNFPCVTYENGQKIPVSFNAQSFTLILGLREKQKINDILYVKTFYPSHSKMEDAQEFIIEFTQVRPYQKTSLKVK